MMNEKRNPLARSQSSAQKLSTMLKEFMFTIKKDNPSNQSTQLTLEM
jgi:hypothetical protein